MGFTITLPSNSSEGVYPDNTISRFLTYLPQEIPLDSEYEVALTEIQYTNSFYNLPEDCKIEIRYTEFSGENLASYGAFRKILIRKGYYRDMDQLVRVCKNELSRKSPNAVKRELDLDYQDVTRKIKLTIPNNTINFKILFPDLLQAIFGFGSHAHTRTQVSERSADLSACVHSMYIYSNIVEPRIVGDAMVPLLRVLAVHGTHNEYVVDNFYHLQYTPVRLRNFRTIEIDLRNNLGKPMPFHSGEAVLTLHFRKAIR